MFGTTLKFFEEDVVPSDALIVCDPATDGGTKIDCENPPDAFDKTVVNVVESNWIVIVEEALKLFPVTVTIVPVAPFTGVILNVVG